jgi:hypothetical protein
MVPMKVVKMLVPRVLFSLGRPTMSITCLNPQKKLVLKRNCILDHVPKVRTSCLIPTHPIPKKKTGQRQSHPTILCTYPKEKGLGGESSENNSCGVNE